MNDQNIDAKLCQRIRQHLDAYLSNELLAETTREVLEHLETCPSCAQEMAARTRLRHALRRSAGTLMPPETLRPSIERQIRRMQPGYLGVSLNLRLVVAVAAVVVVVLGLGTFQYLRRVRQGRQMVANVLALGVSDHLQCAIQGHNYPEAANPPDKLREKLGPEYAGLLAVVKQKLPGFEILEAHICSIKDSPRKYVHFITRGQGTILSVILTRSEGERLPAGPSFRSITSDGVDLYEAHVEGMNVAGFETKAYWGFVVSDLNPATTLQIASRLAPSVKSALDEGVEPGARASLIDFPEARVPATRP